MRKDEEDEEGWGGMRRDGRNEEGWRRMRLAFERVIEKDSKLKLKKIFVNFVYRFNETDRRIKL